MEAIDFFCGAGGLTRGLRDAGFEVIAGFDKDAACEKTYVANNSESRFFNEDIATLSAQKVLKLVERKSLDSFLLTGCAPCQPFSKQRRSGTPRSGDAVLLSRFGAIIEDTLPLAVIVENVPGMAKVKGFSTFRRFVDMLKRLNYSCVFDVLDAKFYGVPQSRRRLVLVALREGQASLPVPPYGSGKRPIRTVRDAISHFPPLSPGATHSEIPNHYAANLSELNLVRLKNTPFDGGDRRDWPDELILECHRNGYKGHTDVYGRMAWAQPAPTLTSKCKSISNGRYAHPNQHRGISLREAAALQSFPDNYVFYGSNEHIARQIGNAVPVRFAEVIGKHVLETLRRSSKRVATAARRKNHTVSR